jgi:hypothetical protein
MTAFLFVAALMSGATSGGVALGAQAAVAVLPRVRVQHFADHVHVQAARRMRCAAWIAKAAVLLLAGALVAGVVA